MRPDAIVVLPPGFDLSPGISEIHEPVLVQALLPELPARFEACERWMLEPSLTLHEIAAELGYSDQAHFTRAFRRWTGEAPSAYRRRRAPASMLESQTDPR